MQRIANVIAAAPVILALVGNPAWSQTAQTVKIVVASAPGGVNEILARMLADQIGRTQGTTIVIENRPGAGEVIGTEAVSRAAPDGNTVLIAASTFVINPQIRKVSYHALTGFEPICHLASSPTVIVVNSASPYHGLADLIDAARARPGALTLASIGPGSPFQIGFEKLKRMANFDMTFVPYAGNAPAVNALLGGHVTSVFATYANIAEQVTAGKLRALAVASRARIEPLPQVPTVAESGFADYEVDSWFGAFAPAKTPAQALSRLAGWFAAALAAPDIRAKLAVQGLVPVGLCGADFGVFVRQQYDDYGRIIRETHIQPE